MTAEPVPTHGDARDLPVTEARAHLSELADLAEYRSETTYLVRRGRGRVAAIVPLETVQAAEQWEDRQLGELASDPRAADQTGGEPPVPADALWRELGL